MIMKGAYNKQHTKRLPAPSTTILNLHRKTMLQRTVKTALKRGNDVVEM